MENLLFIEKTIENDVLFYLCDWSFHQNIGTDLISSSPDSGTDLLDITEPTEIVRPDAYIIMGYDWQRYIDGVLDNIGDTEYIAYAHASYDQGELVTVYTLIYGLQLSDDNSIIPGDYNIIEYTEDINGITSIISTTSNIVVPTPCYSSFGLGSDLRDGISHISTYTILFAIGFAVVFSVCTGFFNFVLNLGKR